MSESSNTITYRSCDGVATLTLNRPPVNVLNIPMIHELGTALQKASEESALRLIIIRAEGKLFSAGVDVKDHVADKINDMIPLFDGVCTALASFPAPTLAVVQGHALGGGCELVMSCDLVLAAEEARFGQPEIKLASFPPIAVLQLPAIIGYRRAAQLVLTGEPISAAEAARIGLINRAVPLGELDDAAQEVITSLQNLSAPALQICKQALRLGVREGRHLKTVEQLYLEKLMATKDAHEGLAAFMEKREVVWTHK